MPEVPADASERVGFERAVAVRLQVAVAEIGQGRLGACWRIDFGVGRLRWCAVVPDERHDVAAWP
jgi:hypothetical protein